MHICADAGKGSFRIPAEASSMKHVLLMVKFIHTSDWHAGLSYSLPKEKSEKLREARYATFKRIIDMAGEESADFILVCGDMFDSANPSSYAVRRVVEILNSSSIPVYVLPGNHDPLIPGSLWRHDEWKNVNGNVQLLEENIEVDAGTALLYPCPVKQKRSALDPTEWIPSRDADRPRIGIAHGSLSNRGNNFPIDPQRAIKSGLRYLALGDWHGFRENGYRCYYSGTPEQTAFDEMCTGNALIVDVSESTLKVSPRPTGKFSWHIREERLQNSADVDHLFTELTRGGDHGTVLLDLRLKISMEGGETVRERIKEEMVNISERYFFLQWKIGIEGEELMGELQSPLLTDLDLRLAEELAKEQGKEKASVISEARRLLRRLGKESE